jgi:hypothetical protein
MPPVEDHTLQWYRGYLLQLRVSHSRNWPDVLSRHSTTLAIPPALALCSVHFWENLLAGLFQLLHPHVFQGECTLLPGISLLPFVVKDSTRLSAVVHSYSPSTRVAEAGQSRVKIDSKTLFEKHQKKKKKKKKMALVTMVMLILPKFCTTAL